MTHSSPTRRSADLRVAGGGRDKVTLRDGTTIIAPILKESAESIWLDLGNEVLELPRTDVEAIERSAEQPAAATESDALFRTATGLAERKDRKSTRLNSSH